MYTTTQGLLFIGCDTISCIRTDELQYALAGKCFCWASSHDLDVCFGNEDRWFKCDKMRQQINYHATWTIWQNSTHMLILADQLGSILQMYLIIMSEIRILQKHTPARVSKIL